MSRFPFAGVTSPALRLPPGLISDRPAYGFVHNHAFNFLYLAAPPVQFALSYSRIEELREERLEGIQTIKQFMDRRFDPARRTCLATGERVE